MRWRNPFCVKLAPILVWLLGAFPAQSAAPLAQGGKAVARIIVAEDCPPATKFAARELAETLEAISGGKFETLNRAAEGKGAVNLFVGRSPAAAAAFPGENLSALAPDEIRMKTSPAGLLLAGGGPRGDICAASRFLQEQCGVRWWTPWASRMPKNENLAVGDLDVRYRPPFELREPFWMPAFDPLWAVHNTCNGQSSKIPAEMGDSVHYKGFVHTFYPLVPPETYFEEHPEWYSLIKGKRTHDRAQLCLTNPKLRDFLVERVQAWLRESPEARIISVSQNDWHGACECENCRALDDREGSHAGTMLDLVNYVAERIEKEFPEVSVDTLAYQYTRKPPQTLRPRKNVIIRLCSIECNFREPLDHPSNAAFAADINGWAAVTDRLYIWDYTTDFGHYVQPHPNWFTLGPNVRFFANHHVRGVFEQGAYQSHGSEMAELRAWVLAQLLWNPNQDDRALVREFLDGYYGSAATPIYSYLEFLHAASQGQKLGCFSGTDAPFLQISYLAPAERLWAKAEEAVQNDPELLARVRLAHLPLRYVWLARWDALQKQSADFGIAWPLEASREKVADEWRAVAAGQPGRPWSQVTLLSEGGLTPDAFLKKANP